VSGTVAGDRFFLAPDATTSGSGVVSAKFFGAFAYRPLLTRVGAGAGGSEDLVSSRLTLNAGASVTLVDRVLFGLDVPFIVQKTPSDGGPDGAALADVRLAARVHVVDAGPVALGTELRFWLPTGSTDALAGDGAVRGSLSAVVSGEVSRISFAASLGFMARERRALAATEVGPAIPFSAAIGVRVVDELVIGPELQGLAVTSGGQGFLSDRNTALIGLLGARYRAGDLLVGGAFGPGMTHTPGVSPQVMLSIAWEPKAPAAEARAQEPATTEPEGTPTPPAETPSEAVAPPEAVAPTPAPVPVPEPAPTPAPPPPPRDPVAARKEARAAFNRGVEAYDAGRYTEAAEAFALAYSILPHIAVLRNLAHSELMSGKYEEACRHFREWKSEAQAPSATDVKQATDGMTRACRGR
jgi:hypothetical protein